MRAIWYARYARLGVELAIDEVWPEKVQGWRKGAGSKIAVGPPIPIYIASDRIPSQHVGVGLAQARPKEKEGIGRFCKTKFVCKFS